mmetsp:Transcript_64926/g.125310  ORF Transcript_64926/g.125310 Transcript_64926/m.125310 type:complete len:96 (+) Transcript_64926:1246-1533(+)
MLKIIPKGTTSASFPTAGNMRPRKIMLYAAPSKMKQDKLALIVACVAHGRSMVAIVAMAPQSYAHSKTASSRRPSQGERPQGTTPRQARSEKATA